MDSRPWYCHLVRFFRVFGVVTLILLLNPGRHEATGAMQRAGTERQIDRVLRRYESMRIDTVGVARQVRERGEFILTTGGRTFDVVLEPHDLRAPEYRAEESSYGGIRRELAPAPVRTYRGTVPGLWNSEARFSVRADSLEGVILTPEEWYYVEPLRNFSPGADPSEMVFYRRSDIVEEEIGTCGATLAHRIGDAHTMVEPQMQAAALGISTADVATEADYEYVTASGGAAQANATILDILNQVDGIYQTQLSISLRVVYQHAWSTTDDPYTSTAPSTMLSEFRDHWNANFYAVAFDLAHMWTGKDMDGSTIGIAYLSVVCQARTYSYGVSQRFTSSPGKYILTAHEIGHNFGATHTDQASPPQTDCTNTIMNSSIGSGFTFCSFSTAEITSHVLGSSSCLTTGPAAPSNLAAIAASSSKINLTWQDNSGTETGFAIERKTGAGGTWQQVGTTIPNATSYSDLGLAANTTYYYRVEANSADGPSAYSNEVSAKTLAGSSSSRCDINADGSVNVLDLQLLINTILGIPGGLPSGDLNSDGNTNVLDLQLLINVVLGFRSCPG
jgi:Metallo-peptidase family M12/Fibronectin type III domain/Dockerin type I domain